MKPGTFTQIYIQLIFAVKFRECLLHVNHRNQIFKYISGIVKNLNHKPIIVNGFSDHVHIFLGLIPSLSISDTVSEIKKSSASWINENNWFPGTFRWQDGYCALSYSKSQVNNVYNYIANQESHHATKSFKNEYAEILKNSEIEFDERFLFDFFV